MPNHVFFITVPPDEAAAVSPYGETNHRQDDYGMNISLICFGSHHETLQTRHGFRADLLPALIKVA
jgi:hypothetical protein